MRSTHTFLLAVSTAFYACVNAGGMAMTRHGGRPYCTVTAHGNKTNDVPNILRAFRECGRSGTVSFPEGQNYWIAEKLNPVVEDVVIDWRGQWTVSAAVLSQHLYEEEYADRLKLSDNLTYWRNNSYPIAFQNHHAGFILTGNKITIQGYNTGGINGNGDVWYTAEAGVTLPGRPMVCLFPTFIDD
jgi:galacturan 1,4-alpha-galacturonidase